MKEGIECIQSVQCGKQSDHYSDLGMVIFDNSLKNLETESSDKLSHQELPVVGHCHEVSSRKNHELLQVGQRMSDEDHSQLLKQEMCACQPTDEISEHGYGKNCSLSSLNTVEVTSPCEVLQMNSPAPCHLSASAGNYAHEKKLHQDLGDAQLSVNFNSIAHPNDEKNERTKLDALQSAELTNPPLPSQQHWASSSSVFRPLNIPGAAALPVESQNVLDSLSQPHTSADRLRLKTKVEAFSNLLKPQQKSEKLSQVLPHHPPVAQLSSQSAHHPPVAQLSSQSPHHPPVAQLSSQSPHHPPVAQLSSQSPDDPPTSQLCFANSASCEDMEVSKANQTSDAASSDGKQFVHPGHTNDEKEISPCTVSDLSTFHSSQMTTIANLAEVFSSSFSSQWSDTEQCLLPPPVASTHPKFICQDTASAGQGINSDGDGATLARGHHNIEDYDNKKTDDHRLMVNQERVLFETSTREAGHSTKASDNTNSVADSGNSLIEESDDAFRISDFEIRTMDKTSGFDLLTQQLDNKIRSADPKKIDVDPPKINNDMTSYKTSTRYAGHNTKTTDNTTSVADSCNSLIEDSDDALRISDFEIRTMDKSSGFDLHTKQIDLKTVGANPDRTDCQPTDLEDDEFIEQNLYLNKHKPPVIGLKRNQPAVEYQDRLAAEVVSSTKHPDRASPKILELQRILEKGNVLKNAAVPKYEPRTKESCTETDLKKKDKAGSEAVRNVKRTETLKQNKDKTEILNHHPSVDVHSSSSTEKTCTFQEAQFKLKAHFEGKTAEVSANVKHVDGQISESLTKVKHMKGKISETSTNVEHFDSEISKAFTNFKHVEIKTSETPGDKDCECKTSKASTNTCIEHVEIKTSQASSTATHFEEKNFDASADIKQKKSLRTDIKEKLKQELLYLASTSTAHTEKHQNHPVRSSWVSNSSQIFLHRFDAGPDNTGVDDPSSHLHICKVYRPLQTISHSEDVFDNTEELILQTSMSDAVAQTSKQETLETTGGISNEPSSSGWASILAHISPVFTVVEETLNHVVGELGKALADELYGLRVESVPSIGSRAIQNPPFQALVDSVPKLTPEMNIQPKTFVAEMTGLLHKSLPNAFTVSSSSSLARAAQPESVQGSQVGSCTLQTSVYKHLKSSDKVRAEPSKMTYESGSETKSQTCVAVKCTSAPEHKNAANNAQTNTCKQVCSGSDQHASSTPLYTAVDEFEPTLDTGILQDHPEHALPTSMVVDGRLQCPDKSRHLTSGPHQPATVDTGDSDSSTAFSSALSITPEIKDATHKSDTLYVSLNKSPQLDQFQKKGHACKSKKETKNFRKIKLNKKIFRFMHKKKGIQVDSGSFPPSGKLIFKDMATSPVISETKVHRSVGEFDVAMVHVKDNFTNDQGNIQDLTSPPKERSLSQNQVHIPSLNESFTVYDNTLSSKSSACFEEDIKVSSDAILTDSVNLSLPEKSCSSVTTVNWSYGAKKVSESIKKCISELCHRHKISKHRKRKSSLTPQFESVKLGPVLPQALSASAKKKSQSNIYLADSQQEKKQLAWVNSSKSFVQGYNSGEMEPKDVSTMTEAGVQDATNPCSEDNVQSKSSPHSLLSLTTQVTELSRSETQSFAEDSSDLKGSPTLVETLPECSTSPSAILVQDVPIPSSTSVPSSCDRSQSPQSPSLPKVTVIDKPPPSPRKPSETRQPKSPTIEEEEEEDLSSKLMTASVGDSSSENKTKLTELIKKPLAPKLKVADVKKLLQSVPSSNLESDTHLLIPQSEGELPPQSDSQLVKAHEPHSSVISYQTSISSADQRMSVEEWQPHSYTNAEVVSSSSATIAKSENFSASFNPGVAHPVNGSLCCTVARADETVLLHPSVPEEKVPLSSSTCPGDSKSQLSSTTSSESSALFMPVNPVDKSTCLKSLSKTPPTIHSRSATPAGLINHFRPISAANSNIQLNTKIPLTAAAQCSAENSCQQSPSDSSETSIYFKTSEPADKSPPARSFTASDKSFQLRPSTDQLKQVNHDRLNQSFPSKPASSPPNIDRKSLLASAYKRTGLFTKPVQSKPSSSLSNETSVSNVVKPACEVSVDRVLLPADNADSVVQTASSTPLIYVAYGIPRPQNSDHNMLLKSDANSGYVESYTDETHQLKSQPSSVTVNDIMSPDTRSDQPGNINYATKPVQTQSLNKVDQKTSLEDKFHQSLPSSLHLKIPTSPANTPNLKRPIQSHVIEPSVRDSQIFDTSVGFTTTTNDYWTHDSSEKELTPSVDSDSELSQTMSSIFGPLSTETELTSSYSKRNLALKNSQWGRFYGGENLGAQHNLLLREENFRPNPYSVPFNSHFRQQTPATKPVAQQSFLQTRPSTEFHQIGSSADIRDHQYIPIPGVNMTPHPSHFRDNSKAVFLPEHTWQMSSHSQRTPTTHDQPRSKQSLYSERHPRYLAHGQSQQLNLNQPQNSAYHSQQKANNLVHSQEPNNSQPQISAYHSQQKAHNLSHSQKSINSQPLPPEDHNSWPHAPPLPPEDHKSWPHAPPLPHPHHFGVPKSSYYYDQQAVRPSRVTDSVPAQEESSSSHSVQSSSTSNPQMYHTQVIRLALSGEGKHQKREIKFLSQPFFFPPPFTPLESVAESHSPA
ncbi:hypothetical protein Btru_062617 [Bulinus truncatus]|nr:hypothetical protein Btru_062617 [Bulinus truncatus]